MRIVLERCIFFDELGRDVLVACMLRIYDDFLSVYAHVYLSEYFQVIDQEIQVILSASHAHLSLVFTNQHTHF